MSLIPTLHVLADLMAADHPQFEQALVQLSTDRFSAIHLRDRRASGLALATLAARVQKVGVRCIINDRVDVALACETDGVHLPADGLPTPSARSMIGEKLIGRSTHGREEASAALNQGADFVFLGPIWPTATHPGMPALGVELPAPGADLPIIAIGGVTPDRIPGCLEAGFHGVAAIGAVWGAANPADVIRSLQVLLEQ